MQIIHITMSRDFIYPIIFKSYINKNFMLFVNIYGFHVMFWLGKHYKSYGLYSLKITPPPVSMLRVKGTTQVFN